MKVLFVPGIQTNIKIKNGGNHGDKRNFDMLCACADVIPSSVTMIKKSFLQKIWYFFTSIIPLCGGKKEEKKILNEVKETQCDIVFLNNSYFGRMIPKIKKRNANVKVITFFHNLEYSYVLAADKKGFLRKLKADAIKKSERDSVKYSDVMVFLNERDKEDAKRTYSAEYQEERTFIIPVTFDDNLTNADIKQMQQAQMERPLHVLFYGAYFLPNYNGVKWLVENVSTRTACNYEIVGKDFEQCSEELQRENVKVIGTVENLKEHIMRADIVAIPIFEGSGMKLKTVEALMMGKTILGTKETFEGYDIDYDKVGKRCTTPEDFINAIQEIEKNPTLTKFNAYSRQVYETKYSQTVAKQKFEELLEFLLAKPIS